MKCYEGGSFSKWVEVFNDGRSKFINSIVGYNHLERGEEGFGIIVQILNDNEIIVEKIELLNHQKFSLHLYNTTQDKVTIHPSNIVGFFSTLKFYDRQWLIPLKLIIK